MKHKEDGTLPNAPGFAGNMFTISAAEDNGKIYVYTNDEWGRGIHQWALTE